MDEKMKILITDDNNEIIKIMKRQIEKYSKFEIVGICQDIEKEKSMIENLKPNVVITNIRKNKEWTGLNIIEEYKQREDKPIFCVVSASATIFLKEMQKIGVCYYLDKPYLEEDFIRMLTNIYNEIYPRDIVIKRSEMTETTKQNHINYFFRQIKKRIGT